MATNAEKFKTAEERGKAFNAYCHKRECCKCELHKFNKQQETHCAFHWLNLEYKEELKPCPFCGSKVVGTYRSDNVDVWYVSCDICGVRTEGDTSKDTATAAWNRRVG